MTQPAALALSVTGTVRAAGGPEPGPEIRVCRRVGAGLARRAASHGAGHWQAWAQWAGLGSLARRPGRALRLSLSFKVPRARSDTVSAGRGGPPGP